MTRPLRSTIARKTITGKMKQCLAAFLCVTMLAPSLPAAAAAGGRGSAPAFGEREEDWDYNRAKLLMKNKVFSLYHNEYLEYKRFRMVDMQRHQNAMNPSDVTRAGDYGVYFEFSYPYNCAAQAQLYEITDPEMKKLIQSGEKVQAEEKLQAFLDGMNPETPGTGWKYQGILEGRNLQPMSQGRAASFIRKG